MSPRLDHAYRLVGPASAHAIRALELPLSDVADALCLALGPNDASLHGVAEALPDPKELGAGVLIVIPAKTWEAPSMGARLRSVLGRSTLVSRSDRCGALLARGYVEIGARAGTKDEPDLAWGFATGSS